jgi:Arm DNA-binding domain
MLTDAKCRTATVEDGKEKKISDGFGLYLLVKPSRSKLWHMAYRFNGRQKKLSFGVYGPDGQGKVSLAAARQKRDAAKTLIAQGSPRASIPAWPRKKKSRRRQPPGSSRRGPMSGSARRKKYAANAP